MPTLRNNFVRGKMNLDIDERLLPKGEHRTASNIRISNSNGSDVGAIEKNLSNKKLTSLNLGSNIKTIGGISDEFKEKIYWLVRSDLGSYIIEYDIVSKIVSFVLKDTRTPNVLDLNEEYLVTGIVLVIDTDNDNRFLIYTDNNKQPRCVNIERAKSYGENGFDEEAILLIKKPPLDAPVLSLNLTKTFTENNIEEKFLLFAYRYKYLDGEYSAMSPISEVAFRPKKFNFDFSTSTNESMINSFNIVRIEMNTGGKLITDVELVFKESLHNNLYLVERYNKKEKGWADDTNVTVDFYNNKIYKTLPERQLFRSFDGVPLKAKALDVINNLLVFGNYTENWNLTDAKDAPIDLNLELEVVSTEVTSQNSYTSNKTNRDYEVGIVYGETYGRHATVLTSENNTAHVPGISCAKKNELKLTIKSKPPKFADWFRICIKQNIYDYDSIIPTLFYEDGIYRWIKLDGGDKDKIKEGDIIIVKSDTQGILSRLKKIKVLEIKSQGKNFLQPDDSIKEIKELSGLYFKIKPDGFRLNIDDFENFEIDTYHNARRKYHDVLTNNNAIIGILHSYATGLDDVTANTGSASTLSDMTDKRIVIEIVFTDTFKWSQDNGANWSADIVISIGVAVSIVDGLEITFGSENGYTPGDNWAIYLRGKLKSSNSRAYGFFRTQGQKYLTMSESGFLTPEEKTESEIIEAGARINLKYDEWNRGDVNFNLPLISSTQYDNIQEWYYKESIGNEIIKESSNFDLNRIFFMRGILKKDRNGNANYLEYHPDGFMTMVVESQNTQSKTKWVYVRAKTTLFQSNGETNIIFETIKKEKNSDIFQEIGRTYPIVGGFHTSGFEGDENQTESQDLEIMLPYYNCFGWGNGFESIKIKDLFNANSYIFQTRPNSPIENYRENIKIASFTYSQPYSQSLNYNGLNEFNLSENNSKDLDDKVGSIQHIKTHNNDLVIFQEDKVHKVLYGKTVLYNEDGSSNIAKSNLPFESVIPYSGEYGTIHPESVAAYGNYLYWVDAKRGTPLRKGQSGIEAINYGLVNWFRDYLKLNYRKPIFGSIDPHFNQYTITLEEDTEVFIPELKCGNELIRFDESAAYEYHFRLNSLSGDVVLNYDITEGHVDIVANFDGVNTSVSNVTGLGTIIFDRSSLTEDLVKIIVTPIGTPASYSILNTCPIGNVIQIVHVLLSSDKDVGTTMTNRYKWGDSNFYEEPILFDSDLVKFKTYTGIEGVGRFPKNGENIEIAAFKNSRNTGSFDASIGDQLGYHVSETVYTESNITTLLNSATFPTITTSNNSSIIQIDSILFELNKPSTGSILYLIWDYSKLNLAPVAVDDNVSVNSGENVVITVLSNDSDPEGDPLTVIIKTQPSNGTIILNSDGTVTYTHDGSDNLTDSFTYCVNDGSLDSNIATVSIGVPPPCDSGMDVVFIFDYTASMSGQINAAKTGALNIISTIQSQSSPNDYRLGLVIADELTSGTVSNYSTSVEYSGLPASQRIINSGVVERFQWITAMEMMSANNQTSFTTQLNKLNNPTNGLRLGSGISAPEPTDIAISRVIEFGFAGSFRSNVAKYIILITDQSPSGDDDIFDSADIVEIDRLTQVCISNFIKVIVLGGGVNTSFGGVFPWQDLADNTGGSWNVSYDATTIQSAIINGCTL